MAAHFAIHTVTAVNTTTKKVTLDIAGVGHEVRYPSTLAPLVGDAAWCLIDNTAIRPFAFDR